MIVNSSVEDEQLQHVEGVRSTILKAIKWKQQYEDDVLKNDGIIIAPPKDGSNDALDEYLMLKKNKLSSVRKFISAEFKPFDLL